MKARIRKHKVKAGSTCMRSPDARCIYCWLRCALRSSLRCANATYRGFDTKIRPFISVTAFVASSGELKQTKPNPFDLPPSYITCGHRPTTGKCWSGKWQSTDAYGQAKGWSVAALLSRGYCCSMDDSMWLVNARQREEAGICESAKSHAGNVLCLVTLTLTPKYKRFQDSW